MLYEPLIQVHWNKCHQIISLNLTLKYKKKKIKK